MPETSETQFGTPAAPVAEGQSWSADSSAGVALAPEARSPVSGFRWYAIQTLSNMEGKVKKYLDKFIEVDDMSEYFAPPVGRPLSDRVLMPTEMVQEVKNGKKTVKQRKLYPNYMFLQMRLYDDFGKLLQKPWYFVTSVQGVISFIGGNEPVPLKPIEIERILQQVEEAEGRTVPSILYNVGDSVKINNGPFANTAGIVEAVDSDRGRLQVSVSIFGRFTPVEFEFWQVERSVEQ
ncbi:MAG: transcription termination/antitermination protein NusG [Puniceicoccales bacterium]|jgi:transcriptional antiterminator NusG|nr:transcription termination/antitermination protein NusG [Puniceicoccales bacterium]